MNSSPSRFRSLLAASTVLVLSSGLCMAQVAVPKDKDKDKKKPQPSKTTQPAPAPGTVAKPAPIADQVLKLSNSKDWTVDAELTIAAAEHYEVVDKAIVPIVSTFKFTSAAIVFPIVMESAASKVFLDGKEPKLSGQLSFNDTPYDMTPTFMDGYAAGTRLARFELLDVVGNQAKLKFRISMTCWETAYDDKLAQTLAWPTTWPPVANSTFKKQLFVDLDDPKDTRLKDMIDQWLDKKDPKSMPPARLARTLANKALEYCQPSGEGLLFNRNSSFMGFDLIGTTGMLNNRGRGSEHDIACFLTAVFRTAGLPARTVIGYDRYDDKAGNALLRAGSGGQKLRSWVEFALVDPATPNKEFWVPVDIVRMRKSSSRARPVDQPQKYFGTSDEFAYIQPIAFQFHPPTTVTAKAAAFWGWLTNPSTDIYDQWIKFQSMRTANTPDNPYRRDKQKDDDKKGK